MIGCALLLGIGLAGFIQVLAPAFFGSLNTVYSAGYSEARFQHIRPGMTAEEVESLMGPPLERFTSQYGDEIYWAYTLRRSGGGRYWKREVALADDIVVRCVDTYWID